MWPCRLHLTGASGTGTTTLGRAIATEQSVPHADADDYFWLPTSPPYTHKRDPVERVRLMEEVFLPRDAWVLSGSVMGWGRPLLGRFDAVVFLTLGPAARLARLHTREALRHGAAVAPGGPQEEAHRAFLEWARGYDDPGFTGRSRGQHDHWLSELPCPVLRLDSDRPVPQLVQAVTGWVEQLPGAEH
jgi:adenylate kinase family enzyme